LQYRKLGKTGLKVSAISMGSWQTFGNSAEKERALATIDRAYELGINFFDSANSYDFGEAERFLGEALRKYPRSSYVVTTKAYWPMGDRPNDYGLSRKHIIEQVHASLKRMGLDYIDIFYCHRFDSETPIEETLRTIDDLVRQGKILYVGVSEWTVSQMTDALGIANHYLLDRIVVNQPAYNLFNRYIEDEVIPFGEKSGISQVVFSPLAQGVLTGKYKIGQQIPLGSRASIHQSKKQTPHWVREDVVNGKYRNGQLWPKRNKASVPTSSEPIGQLLREEFLNKVKFLDDIAKELDISLSQMALAWVLRHSNIASAIIGASRPSQIEENIQAVDIKLSDEVLKKIDEILKPE
jgi:aryl-alcohol dehydrogenase-like predicted oxidoreductase